MTGLLLIVLFALASCAKNIAGPAEICPPDVPLCECRPERCAAGAAEKKLRFHDRTGKSGLNIQFEESGPLKGRLNKAVETLMEEIPASVTAIERPKILFSVKCGEGCGDKDEIEGFVKAEMRRYLEGYTTTDSARGADFVMEIGIENGGVELKFSAGPYSASRKVGGSGLQWVEVRVPVLPEEDDAKSELQPFWITRRVIRASDLDGGSDASPSLTKSRGQANIRCGELDSEGITPSLYVFEHALRQGVILGNRMAMRELVRLPSEDYPVEIQMIDEIDDEEERFPFEAPETFVLIFNWSNGEYSKVVPTSLGADSGFRCMKKAR